MATRSNRTDGGLDFFRADAQQEGVDFFRDPDSAPAVDEETPSQKPLERNPGEGFLQQTGDLIGSALRAVLPPTMTGVGPEERQEDVESTAGRAIEGTILTGRAGAAIPAGAEWLLREGIEELGGKEIPDVVQVGDIEVSTRPFQDIVAQTNYSADIVRNWFGNDENQFLNLVADVAGGYATGEQIFRAAPFVNKFVANRLSPALFRPLVNESAEAAALSKAPAAIRSRLLGATGAATRTTTAGSEGALFMAGIEEEKEASDILLGLGLGVGLQGGAEVLGAVLRRKAARAFPNNIDDIRRIARSGEDISIEGFPEFLARTDANLQLGSPYGQTSDEAVASIRATLSEQGETGAIGAVRGLTELTDEHLGRLSEAFPNYRFEVLGGARTAGRFEIEEAAFRDAQGNVFRTGPVHNMDEVGDEVVQRRITDELAEGQAERGFVDNEGRFISSERAQRLTGADQPESSFIAGTTAGAPLRGDPVSDQKLLYGLQPGTTLPEGTRSAPSLTDKVIDDFRRTGFLRDQKVLVDGVEHRFLSAAGPGDQLLVKPKQGKPITVSRDRVARLDETEGLLRNPRLLEQFRQWRGSQQIDDVDRAADRFMDQFVDDLDPSFRPHLKRYFREQETKLLAQRLRPDESAALQQFRSARRQLMQEGVGPNASLETLAAARGHTIHRMSGGRVKTTNLVTGETKGPFRNPGEASAYLRELETYVPDVTPSIPGVPDDMLEGMAISAPQPNPGIPSGEDLVNVGIMERFRNAPEAFKNLWTDHLGRWATQMEPAARRIEQRTGDAIWSEGILPVQNDLAIVRNRSTQFMDRLNGIFKGVDEADQDLIEGWLRSEAKDQFVRSQDMPERLVGRAEELRLWFEDFFNEMSTATGTDLNADDWLRNYAPDMMDYTAQTGRNDYVELFRNTQDNVPNEVQFFAEMFKSGELALSPQSPLYAKAARSLRAGMFKAHAGRSFENAVEFAKTLDRDGVAFRHLIDYLTGVRGPTDMVRQRLNRALGDLYEDLGINIGAENQRNVIDGMMDATYGGLIGWRPAMIMRNTTQPLNLGGPILGYSRVARSQARALRPELHEEAIRLGVVETRPAVPFGETLEEGTGFLNRLGSKGLKGYTAADEWNRVALWDATRRKARGPLQRFVDGDLNHTEFFEESGLWIMDQPQRQTFMEILEGGRTDVMGGDDAIERALNFAGDEIGSKLTNFMYGAKNQPRWTRGTIGRVFGSYGTWPMGYINWLSQMASADVRRGVKLKALAQHGAFNISVSNVGKAAGVGLGSWVAWNSITFSGGPLREFLFSDIPNLWGGMPRQREEAYRNVVRQAPRFFLPGGQLMFSDIPTGVERISEGRLGAGVAEAAGFQTFDRGERPAVPSLPTPFGDIPPTQRDATNIELP